MLLSEIVRRLDAIAPPHLAEPWDNVGLLVGDPAADVTRAVLCIDYTAAVAAEARALRAEFVLAYHPPLFKPTKTLTADGASALVFDAVRRGVALYSPHTALDVADGGTNDVLAGVLGLTDLRPMRPATGTPDACKLVTFVPADAVDAVAAALFAAGAGRIGNYAGCSFRGEGVGTFDGDENARPAVGQPGRAEAVAEVRVETVVPLTRVADVVAAMNRTHPYETPAFDLIPLIAPPSNAGLGRVGRFERPVAIANLLERIKAGLGVSHLLVAGPVDRVVSTGVVCAGSCGEFANDVLATRADVYVTGEARHHDALAFAAAGMTLVCTLHSHSERVTLRSLATRLTGELPGVTWTVAASDADPFSVR